MLRLCIALFGVTASGHVGEPLELPIVLTATVVSSQEMTMRAEPDEDGQVVIVHWRESGGDSLSGTWRLHGNVDHMVASVWSGSIALDVQGSAIVGKPLMIARVF